MIEIDGSEGEGGGQVLRTALSLSCITGEAFRLTRIRAKRRSPGLANQHLTAVRAAATISRATVTGDALGSTALEFVPEHVNPSSYDFDVGTAGSVGLVLQTVLPPLLLAGGDSRITTKGGTDTRWAPTVGYVGSVYVPALGRLGARTDLRVSRRGFYPRGGGEARMTVEGGRPLRPVSFEERGGFEHFDVTIDSSQLPDDVPGRVARRCRGALAPYGSVEVTENDWSDRCPGAGIGLCVTAVFGRTVMGTSAAGERGLPSEKLAADACDALLADFRSKATVDIHAADQLLLPMAVAPPGSSFVARELTGHARTNMDVIGRFLGDKFEIFREGGAVRVATV